MIRNLLFLALLAPLGACDWAGKPPPPPPRPEAPRHADRGPDWLRADPDCRGSMRRGEWLVCDNPNLAYLHRTLAAQWETERQGGDRQRLFIQRQQLQALLSERAACETADCVVIAYRRFLSAPPRPAPTAKPVAKPKPRPRPIRQAHRPSWNWRDNAPGCASRIGWQSAALLSRRCEIVDPDGQCSPQRSCSALRTMIREGCWEMGGGRPGFCNRR